MQETKAPQGKKPRRLVIIVAAVAVCAIAAALFLLARPAMAVSAAISGLKGPDLPPIQEIQAAKERYGHVTEQMRRSSADRMQRFIESLPQE